MARKIFSVVLSILIFALSFVLILSASIKFRLYDIDYYVERVVTQEYFDALYDDIDDAVTLDCRVLEIERDTVMSFVDKDEISSIAVKRFRSVMSHILYGEPLQAYKFSNPEMMNLIYDELDAFAQSIGLEDEDIETSARKNYEFIINDINKMFDHFSDSDFEKASVISRLPGRSFIMGAGFYVLAVIYVFLIVIKLAVNGKRKLLRSLYNSFFMSWIASALIFFPMLILKMQDIPSKVVIAYSGFRLYVQQLIYSVINPLFLISLVIFSVLTVLVIIMIVLNVRKAYNTAPVDDNQKTDIVFEDTGTENSETDM